jgi:hypothetical protein
MEKDNFEELYKIYKSKAKTANRNIKKIQDYMGTADAWAIKKLKSRMENKLYNGWTSGNRVSLSKPKDIKELKARLSALDKFFQSKTHTVRGIKKVEKEIKETIKEKIAKGDEDKLKNITKEEIETFYDMFTDEDTKFFMAKIGESNFWSEINEAQENNDSYDEFYHRIVEVYFETDFIDDDVKERVTRIYEKYILGEK